MTEEDATYKPSVIQTIVTQVGEIDDEAELAPIDDEAELAPNDE